MDRIKIAIDFSRTPGIRTSKEGSFPAKDFRENILVPKLREAIRRKELLEIDLDGTAGIGTSFLEESFGGLIRENKIPYEEIISTLNFISEEEPNYIEEIQEYLKDAHENEK